jgi:hypothetical protein
MYVLAKLDLGESDPTGRGAENVKVDRPPAQPPVLLAPELLIASEKKSISRG